MKYGYARVSTDDQNPRPATRGTEEGRMPNRLHRWGSIGGNAVGHQPGVCCSATIRTRPRCFTASASCRMEVSVVTRPLPAAGGGSGCGCVDGGKNFSTRALAFFPEL